MALYQDGVNSLTISIYFVQYGASCSKEMRKAFSVCQEAKFNPKIISEDDVKEIKLTANIVFVVETFSGDIFQYLSSSDCLIVGPCCISSCIAEKIAIPNNGSPVFNIALRGVVICTTYLDKNEKNEIRKLGGFMGAVNSDDLTLAVTHLIAEKASLQSGKFVKACENNIPIIIPDWIRKSWELTQLGAKAPDPDTFKMLPFRGMHISCSNLSMAVKKKLQTVIEANGGFYQRTLELNKTAVLIIGDPEGKKWQHAQQWGIPCVAPSWVYESAEKGFLAPSKNHFIVPRPKCSTPTNSGDSNSFMSCSDISCVPLSSDRSNVDETNVSFASDISVRSIRSEGLKRKQVQQDGEYKKLLEEVTPAEIKAGGLFLDGCKIFLSGFTTPEVEKLKKIINSGGATLYTSISDSLSHVVVGNFSPEDAKELLALASRPYVVKLEWLVGCLKEKRTIGVEPYLCLHSAPAPPASPLSHKGLKLLKSNNGSESPTAASNESRAQVSRKLFVKASVVRQFSTVCEMTSNSIDVSALERRALDEMNREKEEQLRKEKELEQLRIEEESRKIKEKEELKQKEDELRLAEQSKTKRLSNVQEPTCTDTEESMMKPFFEDRWFKVFGYEDIQQIQESIEAVGGRLVTSPSHPIPDYAIVPVEGTDSEIKAKNIVSIIFVEDCYDNGCLIKELEYYHQPIIGLSSAEKKLEEAVLGLSGFSRAERRLLVYIATRLGALVQDMFSRTDHPDKGVKKSTHLICKEMSGKKYEAALKWGIPVVRPSWLLKLVEKSENTSQSSKKSVSLSVEENSIMEEIVVANPNESTQPMEIDAENPSESTKPMEIDAENPNDITPLNQILRRISIPGSGGPSPFHVQTPETPYGRIFTDSTPSPDTRKRWKKWIDSFPDHYEGSPAKRMKPRRPSTPLDVVKKQLWVKFGGVSFEGIEPETGKLLPNGPYGEWAENEDSFPNDAEEIKSGVSGVGSENCDPEDIIEAIHKRLSDIRSSEVEEEEAKRKNGSNLSAERMSSRFELSQGTELQTYVHREKDDQVLWDFQPAKSSKMALSSNDVHDKHGETSRNLSGDITNQILSATKAADFINTTDEKPTAAVSKSHLEATKRPCSATKHSEKPKENVPANQMGTSKISLKTSKLWNSEASEKLDIESMGSPEQILKKVPRINERRIIHMSEVTKIFLISGLLANAKLKYEGIIRQLGGGVTQTPSYDSATTHIIVEKPIRSEKLLCCIASGKWVLHTSYVESCYEARTFLPEEEFEWGNQSSASRLPRLKANSTESGLANASYRWRQRKNDLGSASPFREMKVVLLTSENKLQQFKRLLEAGDATILDKSEILKANYIIWEEGKVEMCVPLVELVRRKIHVVPPVYLGEYLVKTPPPSEYYPESYSKLFKSKKISKR